MGQRRTALIVVVFEAASVLAGTACTAPPTTPTAVTSFSSYASRAFTFHYTALDASTIAMTADALERAHDRLRAEVGLASMPTVTVTLHPSPDSLRSAVTPSVGTVPAFATGFLTAADVVHILSPNLSARWTYETGVVNIVHEFAHCVSLRLNPAIGNNPRWLWETFALYYAGQHVDPRRIAAFADGEPPTLMQLNNINDSLIYDVGGVLGDFIVTTWGQEMLITMVRSHGNLEASVGLSESAFLQRWMEFIGGRYPVLYDR